MTTSKEPAAFVPQILSLPPNGHGYDEHLTDCRIADISNQEKYDLFGATPVDEPSLFWYRWITGHQISFILWRTLSDALGRNPHIPPTPEGLEVITACVDGYSAMLLYSATVPRDHYHTHIRLRMALQHPSFSGAWAPDYRPIRQVFREKLPWQDDPSCAYLREALALNHLTHDYIADHLVPDGRSLLQQNSGAASFSREKEDLYDNFFLTVRRPASRSDLTSQLNSRIVELAADLKRNGLYPEIDGRHHPVVPEASPEAIGHLTTSVLRILHRAALVSDKEVSSLEEVHR